MASRTLQDWQNYISDYQQKLAAEKVRLDAILADPSKTAAEKKKALDDYTRNKMFLQELIDKYNEFSQTGEVPDEVTFGGGAPTSVIVYKTNIPGDEANIHYGSVGTIGGSGDLSTPNSEIPLGTIFQSDLINVNVKVYESQGYTQPAYDDVTIGQQYTVDSGGTMYWHIKSDKNLPYGMVNRFSVSGIPGTTISDDSWPNSNDRIVIEATWGNITNIRTIEQNRAYTVSTFLLTLLSMLTNPEGTVDGDSPWDYYDKIKPSVNPDNNLYPDGYTPPGPGNDPDDDPEEEIAPDKNDWGDEDEPWGDFYPSQDFNNYAAFNAVGIEQLKISLWDSPDSFWDALSILGSNSANYLDYLVSLRVYPYDVGAEGDYDTLYLGRGGQLFLPGGEGAFTHYGVPMKVRIFPFEIKAEKYYNNFLDFAPYTKAELYLPFSGVWELNPKYVYHTTLKIYLYLDITDGSGIWEVYNAEHGKRLLIKQCKIGIELPLSGNDAIGQSSQIVNATLGLAQTVTGGVPKIANSTLSAIGTATNEKATTLDTVGAGVGIAAQLATTGLDIFSAATNLANANREMPCYTGGTTGLAAAQQGLFPTLTLIRPVVENPATFPHTVGHLVNQASKLEKLSGFTTCRNVDVSNVPQATDKEKAELKRILESGFYAVSG